jgi:hypothetical protein
MKNTFLLLLFALFLTSGCGDDDGVIIDPPMDDPEPSSLGIGVLLHVPFSGNADDISSVGLSGTITGATITADRNGVANEAYRFDGENDFINLGQNDALSLGSAEIYTMTAWVKPELQDDPSTMMILSKFDGGVSAGWYVGINAEDKGQVYRNVAPWATYGINPFPRGEYVHLAAVFDGANLSIYVNGTLDASTPFRTHPQDRTTDVLIGANHSRSTPNAFFKGTIDDVRIYNRVLTDTELTWLATH